MGDLVAQAQRIEDQLRKIVVLLAIVMGAVTFFGLLGLRLHLLSLWRMRARASAE
jgi:hypothetical protein